MATQVHGQELVAEQRTGALSIYRKAEALLSEDNSYFRSQPKITEEQITFEYRADGTQRPIFLLTGKETVVIKMDATSLHLRSIYYDGMRTLLKTAPYRHPLPKLTLAGALAKAQEYLKQSGVEVPPYFRPFTISYDRMSAACWDVRWRRVEHGYMWDDFDQSDVENASVIFHEEYGLILAGANFYSPAPKSYDVRITAEEAIEKAAESAPAVMETSFYRFARAQGFSVNQLLSCDLKIAIPNWLLDPKRARWIREKPPEETRLCWVVRFGTVDTRPAERPKGEDGKPIRLNPPEIVMYVDAASGEIVGANFN
jgi:hypothetical protein